MKRIILLILLSTLFSSCKKKEYEIHPSLIGTWNIYYNDNTESQFFSIDNKTLSFFKYSNFSYNYEIIDYSQVGSDFPIQITVVGKSKSKNTKNTILEFKLTLISDDSLYNSHGSPNYSLNYWYTKI